MCLVQIADVVFSYCDTRIKAIGRVTGTAQDSDKPAFGNAGDAWSNNGWLVPVEFVELDHQVHPKDFIQELIPFLPEKYSPLRHTGDGLQSVYLAQVPDAMAAVLLHKIGREAEDYFRPMDLSRDQNEVEHAIEQRTDITATTKIQLVLARRGQGLFKANVRLVERQCRITGVTDPRLLIASHIKPWSESSDFEKLDGNNGFLLSPHVDKLFDLGLISFTDSGQILVSPSLNFEVLQRWRIDVQRPAGPFNQKQCQYLQHHRTERFKKG
jgi:putative restriction endonuclease